MSAFSQALKTLLLGQLNSALAGGKLALYTGAPPATPDDPATGSLVVELPLQSPAGSVGTAGGVTSLSVFPPPATALAPTAWSQVDKGAACTLSNGDLTAESNSFASVRSVAGVSSGKWYWEVTFSDIFGLAGIGLASAQIEGSASSYPGAGTTSWAFYNYSAAYVAYHNDAGTPLAGVDSVGAGGVVGLALDMDAGTLSFVIGGVVTQAFTGIVGTVYAMVGGGSTGAATSFTANFGGSAFTQAVPVGYAAGLGAISSGLPTALISATPGYGRVLSASNVAYADLVCGTDLVVAPAAAVSGDEVHVSSLIFTI